jgi:hypothetical protein
VLETGAPLGPDRSQGYRSQRSQDDWQKHAFPFLGLNRKDVLMNAQVGIRGDETNSPISSPNNAFPRA